tara:strand:- start:840 stop:1163 length:324 start_codon:yes stop_codon:yes gene_type:complete
LVNAIFTRNTHQKDIHVLPKVLLALHAHATLFERFPGGKSALVCLSKQKNLPCTRKITGWHKVYGARGGTVGKYGNPGRCSQNHHEVSVGGGCSFWTPKAPLESEDG